MPVVTLKNGTRAARATVEELMQILRRLVDEHPDVFSELVLKCCCSSRACLGVAYVLLKQLRLIHSDGSVNADVRNVLLSAVDHGKLNSPIQE